MDKLEALLNSPRGSELLKAFQNTLEKFLEPQDQPTADTETATESADPTPTQPGADQTIEAPDDEPIADLASEPVSAEPITVSTEPSSAEPITLSTEPVSAEPIALTVELDLRKTIEKLSEDLAEKEKFIQALKVTNDANLVSAEAWRAKHKEVAAQLKTLSKEKADRQAVLEKYKSADLVETVAKLDRDLIKQQQKAEHLGKQLKQTNQILGQARKLVEQLDSKLYKQQVYSEKLERCISKMVQKARLDYDYY